jgi:hypothetical protein
LSVSISNGSTARGNGPNHPAPQPADNTARAPRRIVLLAGAEDSAVERVLLEYDGRNLSGKQFHADVQRLAGEHRGRCVAGEWLGPLGWTRFLTCRK